MFFKAIKILIGSNGLILIIPVFNAYLKIIKLDVPLLLIILHVITIKKTINKVQKCIASQQIYNVLNSLNRVSIVFV